jgi:uncharacterized membrane protein
MIAGNPRINDLALTTMKNRFTIHVTPTCTRSIRTAPLYQREQKPSINSPDAKAVCLVRMPRKDSPRKNLPNCCSYQLESSCPASVAADRMSGLLTGCGTKPIKFLAACAFARWSQFFQNLCYSAERRRFLEEKLKILLVIAADFRYKGVTRRNKKMSTLVVVAYNELHKAEELRVKLQEMQSRYLLDVAEVVVATIDEKGKIKLDHAGDLTDRSAACAGFAGSGASLANLILMNAAPGRVFGALAEAGINDHFMKELAATLVPGSSALFVLTRRPSPDRDQMLEEVKGLGGKILMTSLSEEDQAKLQAALAAEKS